MRVERIIEEVAKEIAKRAGVDWNDLPEEQKEAYRAQAEANEGVIRERLNDAKRKYEE